MGQFCRLPWETAAVHCLFRRFHSGQYCARSHSDSIRRTGDFENRSSIWLLQRGVVGGWDSCRPHRAEKSSVCNVHLFAGAPTRSNPWPFSRRIVRRAGFLAMDFRLLRFVQSGSDGLATGRVFQLTIRSHFQLRPLDFDHILPPGNVEVSRWQWG